MSTHIIKDYWCFGCGLVANTDLVCPVCGSTDYGVITLNLTNDPNREQLMELYKAGSLYVHREGGQLALRSASVGPVAQVEK